MATAKALAYSFAEEAKIDLNPGNDGDLRKLAADYQRELRALKS